jgi:tetratricopeptide (TPR) repeat protein
LQYKFTKEEQAGLKTKLESEVKRMYEGSVIRQSKLDTLIALDPENEEYYRSKSFTHSRIGDYHIGFPLIEKAITLDPFDALYYSGWQLLYLYRDYDRALEYLAYYDDIAAGVNYIWGENIHYLKGLAYKQKKLYDQAVEEFSLCVEYEGENTDEYVYVYRGIARLRNECLEDAINDFDMALERFEKCTMALVYKGEALLNLNEFERAKSNLLQAKALLHKGSKKTHPYVEVFDEVHLIQVNDLLHLIEVRENSYQQNKYIDEFKEIEL